MRIWTEAEEEQIIKYYQDKMVFEEMGKIFGTTKSVVMWKVYKMAEEGKVVRQIRHRRHRIRRD
jgi:hypothetical protein